MSEKIFCGKGKKGQYSIKLNICLDDIPSEFKTVANNGKTYLRLEASERRSPDEKGNTHFVTVDTWKPNQQSAPQAQAPKEGYNPSDYDPKDPNSLPF